ncbi:MAG TPA: hypothetical protein VLX92_24260 [Kofleriaceae bacterium]|nr:hypothetical protein [Kofleriaceae bacterium]
MSKRLGGLALAAGLALGAPAVSAAPEHPVAAQQESAPAAPTANAEDGARYAAREHHRRDRQAAEFQGGSIIAVGISTTALVVILIAAVVFL